MIKNDAILSLLQKHIDTEIEYTLEFREVYTGALVTLVKKAYQAGFDQGFDEGVTAEEERVVSHAKEGRN